MREFSVLLKIMVLFSVLCMMGCGDSASGSLLDVDEGAVNADPANDKNQGDLNAGADQNTGGLDGAFTNADGSCLADTDNDGICNEADPDLDGDGIPNAQDTDMDGDGILNVDDPDMDGDGIDNINDNDIDGDGIANEQDNDIDGDGILNIADPDIDGDGILNINDSDIDGDGIANEGDADMDGDGILNVYDEDMDGDGILNTNDNDIDGDGIANTQDPDIDGDGILNTADDDMDGDGIPNDLDTDLDGDGIFNQDDPDTDNDNIPNAQDPDDDNDSIPDAQDPTPQGPVSNTGDTSGGMADTISYPDTLIISLFAGATEFSKQSSIDFDDIRSQLEEDGISRQNAFIVSASLTASQASEGFISKYGSMKFVVQISYRESSADDWKAIFKSPGFNSTGFPTAVFSDLEDGLTMNEGLIADPDNWPVFRNQFKDESVAGADLLFEFFLESELDAGDSEDLELHLTVAASSTSTR